MNTSSISTNGLSQIESLSFPSKEDILQLNLTFLITDVKPKEINNKTIYHLSLNDNNKTLSHFLIISQSPRSDIKANNLIHIKTISSSNPSSTRVFLIKSFDIYQTETNDSIVDNIDINNNDSKDKGIFDSQKCHLIHQLTTFSTHIHLYIKVTHKTQLKPFLNKQNNSNGQLFTFNVIDTEGSEMPITVFNKACNMFYNVIKEGGVYEIKGGNVKLNERKYSNVRSDYKVILDENSQVTEVPDNGLFKDIKIVITNINDIPNKAVGTLVNVLAVVLESNDKMNINTKKGDQTVRRLRIGDISKMKIEITLWKQHAEIEGIEKGKIILFKNVRIGHYNGRNLGSIESSEIMIQPNIEEAMQLNSLLEDGINENNWTALPSIALATQNDNNESNYPPIEFSYIKDILSKADSSYAGDDKSSPSFLFKATIMYVEHKEKNYYPGCPEKSCKKKLTQLANGWECQNCKKNYEKPHYYYTLSLKVKDASAEQRIDVFGDIGRIIFGVTAEEYKDIVFNNDTAKMTEINERVEFKMFNFIGKAKIQNYGNGVRKRLNIYKCEPVEYKTDAIKQVKMIKNILANN